MPVQDIQLVREKVTLSVLDAVRLYNFSDILSAFNAAKKVFVNEKKTLLMGDDVERGITEYVKKLRTRVKIQEAMLANALYSYFDALNNFSLLLQKLTPADIRNGKSTSGPNSYSCGSPFCIFSGICKSFVYFLGVECSDENGPQLTSNEKMIKERKLNNGKGGTEVFSLHLKPYTKPCFASDHVLTLRIYFKWDPAEKKILIGWAGRHLFIPPKCPPAKTTCPRRHKDCYPK